MTGRHGEVRPRPGVALSALLTRRREALDVQVGRARLGDVRAVHQARVASRRLREAVPILGAGLDDVRITAVKRRLRALTRALGAVRELDVALGMLDDLPIPDEAARQVRDVWAARLAAQRQAPVRVLRKTLNRRRREALAGGLDDLIRARQRSDDPAWQGALARRVRQRARALADRIDGAGLPYGADPLHEVRIAGKKLRYVLELASETDLVKVEHALRTLKATQESLGRLHDLDVLLGALRSLPDVVRGAPLYPAAMRMAAELEGQARRLHARYLRSRPALVRVSVLADTTVADAILRQPPTAIRAESTDGR